MIRLTFLPIAFLTVFYTTIFATFAISFQKRRSQCKHTYILLCNAGSLRPGKYVFSLGFTVSSVLLLSLVFFMFDYSSRAQYESLALSDSSTRVIAYVINAACLALGVSNAFLMALFSTITVRENESLHNTLAYAFTVSGILYQWNLIALSFLNRSIGNYVIVFRLVTGVVITLASGVMLFVIHAETVFRGSQRSHRRNTSVSHIRSVSENRGMSRSWKKEDLGKGLLSAKKRSNSSSKLRTREKTREPLMDNIHEDEEHEGLASLGEDFLPARDTIKAWVVLQYAVLVLSGLFFGSFVYEMRAYSLTYL